VSDPVNKWNQPPAPPPPMFFGKKERDLVKQVNDELAERVIGQPIAYYPISIEESNFNDTYGEAIDKVSLPPVRVYAYVVVENEQTNDRYGYEYQTKLTINFSEKRLTADQNLYVRVGDFVQYGDQFYEIVKTYNDTRYYFGQVEHKFQISAECVRARQGTFRVLQALDRKPERGVVAGESTTPAPRVAPIPPINATYVTVTHNSRLSNERVLTAGTGITLTDTGANGTLTINSSGQNAVGPTGSLQFTPGAGAFSGSHSLRFYPTTPMLELTGALRVRGALSASTMVRTSELTASLFRLAARSGSLAGSGSYLGLDSNNNVVIARASSTGGGGGTPGGANTQIQFNNAGAFGASANLTYTSATAHLANSGTLGISASLTDGQIFRVDASPRGAMLYLTGARGADGAQVTSLGIGTSNPQYALDVRGYISLGESGGGYILVNDDSDTWIRFGHAGSDSMQFRAGGLNFLEFDENGLDIARINPDGGDIDFQVATLGNDYTIFSEGATDRVGIGTNNPTHTLTVAGALSASGNSFFAGDVTIEGTLIGGSPLDVSGSVNIVNPVGTVVATLGATTSGSIAQFTTLTASAVNLVPTSGTLAGGGSYLGLDNNNNVILTAGDGATTSPAGATTQIQFNNAGSFGASANLTFDGTTVTGSYTGSLAQFAILSASLMQLKPISGSLAGSGSYLGLDSNNNVVIARASATGGGGGTPGGSNTQVQFNNAGAFGASANLTFNGSTLNLTGELTASNSLSASTLHGDGAALTAITIGKAEDNSYADGLFTDFGNTTPVGTAVDRFNEILKALSPGPAPNLDDIDCDDSGASSKLSFGASQGISGYTNVGTTAGFSAVDINGTYSQTTSDNNLRRATFNASRLINGDLNEDVSADGVNYPNNSFGDANIGKLRLEVNGTNLKTAYLTSSTAGSGVPGSGTGTALNSNGSGFYSLSQTGSAEFADGTLLDLFQHRTGKYKVVAADQRDGWNYLRVVHSSSTFERTTNYVEWVVDSNANALAAPSSSFQGLTMGGDFRLSGVKYHTNGTATYEVDVTNAYKNVYTATNISFNGTNGSISSQAMPSITVGVEDENKKLQLTGSFTVDCTSVLDASIGASVNVAHPIKSNLSSGGSKTLSGLLAYNRSNTSTTTSETFRRENFRLDSGSLSSYAVQADVTDAGNAWNSTSSLLTVDGLLCYNQRLYSPTDSDIPNSGDFSTISRGPTSNVDYSGITGARTFLRYFTQTGAASQTNFTLTFGGDSSTKIVPASTSLAASKIHVFVKLPTTSTAMETGWLDLAIATANDPAQLNNGDGAFVGSVPGAGLSINGGAHEGTFVTQTVEQNENIVIKIVADAAWTGYVSSVSVSWG